MENKQLTKSVTLKNIDIQEGRKPSGNESQSSARRMTHAEDSSSFNLLRSPEGKLV